MHLGFGEENSSADSTQKADYVPNFFDSLNNGNEISLTPQDFGVEGIMPKKIEKVAAPSPPLMISDPVLRFQVQFFATKKLKKAKKVKAKAEKKTQLPVMIVGEPPLYKLRIGEFSSRDSAEALKAQMIEIGYKKAWIAKIGE